MLVFGLWWVVCGVGGVIGDRDRKKLEVEELVFSNGGVLVYNGGEMIICWGVICGKFGEVNVE